MYVLRRQITSETKNNESENCARMGTERREQHQAQELIMQTSARANGREEKHADEMFYIQERASDDETNESEGNAREERVNIIMIRNN